MRARLSPLVWLVFVAIIALASANTCGFINPVPFQSFRARNARNVILLTDGTNFDDAVAVNYIVKHTGAKLIGIYTQGNAWANPASSIRNFYNNLYLYNITNIPIWAGAYYALQDERDAVASGMPAAVVGKYRSFVPLGSTGIAYADAMYGQAPFLPQGPNVYDLVNTNDEDFESLSAMLDAIDALPARQKVTIISLGTLTSIAKLFNERLDRRTRSLIRRIENVVQMGGAVNTTGNIFTTYQPATETQRNNDAEFNVINDPHAAQWAFGNLSALGVPITLVPLDATNDVPLQESLFESLAGNPATPEAQLVGRLMIVQRATWWTTDYFGTAFLWDPTAAIVAMKPELITRARQVKLRVEINQDAFGPNQGATRICSPQEASIRGLCADVNVVFDVNANGVTNELINTLQSPINSARRPLFCPALAA